MVYQSTNTYSLSCCSEFQVNMSTSAINSNKVTAHPPLQWTFAQGLNLSVVMKFSSFIEGYLEC